MCNFCTVRSKLNQWKLEGKVNKVYTDSEIQKIMGTDRRWSFMVADIPSWFESPHALALFKVAEAKHLDNASTKRPKRA